MQDSIPELTESFNITIDSVALVNESARQGSFSDTPRVGGATVTVSILANDDANGILEFSITGVSQFVGVYLACLHYG